jgi:small subunit ribosomal protein S18
VEEQLRATAAPHTLTPANMSLTTRLFRAPAAVTKHSLRTFSSSLRQRSNASEGLLDILSGSKVAQSTKQSPIGNSLLGRTAAQAGLNERPTTTTQMIEQERRENFQKQIYRRWQTGDIYSPHDLTGAEQKKWKFGRKKPQSDAFDVLGINPVSEYKVGQHLLQERSCEASGYVVWVRIVR